METIKLIMTAVMFSFYFIEVAKMHLHLKLDFKPFNCMTCLPVWSGAIFYFMPTVVVDFIMICMAAGIFGPLFRNFLINIFNKTK